MEDTTREKHARIPRKITVYEVDRSFRGDPRRRYRVTAPALNIFEPAIGDFVYEHDLNYLVSEGVTVSVVAAPKRR